MKREIYEVYAKVVDANGAYNTLSGYPKVFDSKLYNNDLNKTLLRAQGEYHDTIGAMCKRDDRQLQTVLLLRSDGLVIDYMPIGKLADLPDPEPEPEEEPEET